MDGSQSGFVTIPAAAGLLGCGHRAVKTLIRQGRLTVRDIPGSYPRVPRAEVEALAKEFTKPARSA